MKKYLILAVALMGLAGRASAYEVIYDKAYSTASVTGVRCSTGTAIQINATAPAAVTNGGNLAGYRIQNQGSSDVYFGYSSSVSTGTAVADSLANLGEKLSPASNMTELVGYDLQRKAYVPIWCKAIDAAGATGVVISVKALGYN